MKIGSRIAKARRAAGMSQQELADKIGTGQTTISSWERERTEPTRDDVQRVAKALNIPLTDLEIGDVAKRDLLVKVVGYVGAGDAAHFYDEAQGPLDMVQAPPNATELTVASIIRGPSIGRNFDGWTVYYDEVREPVREDHLGRLCVVGLPDGRVLVKWIHASRTPGIYHLHSETEPPINDQEIIWSARVTALMPQ